MVGKTDHLKAELFSKKAQSTFNMNIHNLSYLWRAQ